MTLHAYLLQKYSPKTAKCYLRDIAYFAKAVQHAENADYSVILDYLEAQRRQQKPASLHRILQGIKKYYSYLINEGLREDNPAHSIQIRDNFTNLPVLPQQLLNGRELDEAWEWFLTKKYRYRLLKNRDISMAGLLLHQGLRAGEFAALKLENLDLQKATVFVPAGSRSLPRTLALESTQVLPFYQYLQERQELTKTDSNALFINKLGLPESGETLHYLAALLRPRFPDKKINPKTLRMSVIARQFERGHQLQAVQYFAGHRFPDSTERYNLSDLQQLQQEILIHHPLAGIL
jgi:site-specific recombinase XerD